MSIVLRLALRSLFSRWPTALLTVTAIALSVTLFIGVEKLRVSARASFADTVSGTDLIIGARAGDVQLLLYSVFRIGNATANITWRSYQEIAARPEVAWMVPISLGDSHRGFRVMGTTPAYFDHYRFRGGRALTFAAGKRFDDLFDAVIGADVAAALGYRLGDPIVVAHGLGVLSLAKHDDKPFRVSGILAKTGTPVDRTVHVSLEAIEAIHVDWQSGRRMRGQAVTADEVRRMELKPRAVTAALVGLKSRLAVFRLQRFINEYRAEPLSAVLPGVALQQLWQLVGTAETALGAVSLMVVATAILGMATMVLAALGQRRREMAILRSVGARPVTILGLLVAEAGALTAAGVLAGWALAHVALLALRGYVDTRFGLYLALDPPTLQEMAALAAIFGAGSVAGLLPGWRAYRMSLADGMTVRF
jgi:putative ABC transport system permease protein